MQRLVAPGTVALLFACVACREPASPSIGNRGLDSLIVAAPTDTADGAHVNTILARIDTAFRGINTVVKFSTSVGEFSTGDRELEVIPDSLGVARAFLKAPNDSTIAYVTATAGGVTKTREIVFVPAPPTWINMTASAYAIDTTKGGTIDLTVVLGRQRGSASPGAKLTLTVTIPTGSLASAKLSADSVFASATGAKAQLILLTAGAGDVSVQAKYSGRQPPLTSSVVIHVTGK